jgi:hypothetical protein
METGSSLQLNASDCSRPTPAYFSGKHRSELTYSGAELTGNVEPQEPCMTVSIKKE